MQVGDPGIPIVTVRKREALPANVTAARVMGGAVRAARALPVTGRRMGPDPREAHVPGRPLGVLGGAVAAL